MQFTVAKQERYDSQAVPLHYIGIDQVYLTSISFLVAL